MMSKVVQLWQITNRAVGVARVGQACVGIPELVEEGVDHGIDCRQALCGSVFEQLGDQVDGVGIGLPENLGEGPVSVKAARTRHM